MLNAVYRLVAPRRFEVEFTDIDLTAGNVIVRPTYLSICNADQRYYQGKRAEDVLRQKLPMALIHEGIGQVVYDPEGEFQAGEKVVMIPNTPMSEDEIIAESVHALSRFDRIAHKRRECVGIWGDGNLGYITAVFFKAMFPDTKLCIFGVNRDKLSDFTFADETYVVSRIPDDLQIDHAIECVGGEGSPKAINQIIDYIRPEGTIAILGVSENPVSINTRMMLEKGLRMFGSSRSGREDFMKTIELYQSNPEIPEYLQNIVGGVFKIRSIDDMRKAFEADIHKEFGKTIMIWS